MDPGAILRPESTSLDTRFAGLNLSQENTDDWDLLCEASRHKNSRRGSQRSCASKLQNLLQTRPFEYTTQCLEVFYNAIEQRNFPMATAILHRGIFTTTHPSTQDKHLFAPWWRKEEDSVIMTNLTKSLMRAYVSEFFKQNPHQPQVVEWMHDGKVRRVKASIVERVYENGRKSKQLAIHPGGRAFYTNFGDISLLDTTRQNLERYLQVFQTMPDFEKQLHVIEMNFFLACIANDITLHTEHADTVISTYKHLIENTSFHISGRQSTYVSFPFLSISALRDVKKNIEMVVFEDLYNDNYSSIVKEAMQMCCFDRFVPGIEQMLEDDENYQLLEAWRHTQTQHDGWKYDLKIEFVQNMIFLSEYNTVSDEQAVNDALHIWHQTKIDTVYKLVRWVIYRHKQEGDQKIKQAIVSFDVIVEPENTVEKRHMQLVNADSIVVMRYDITDPINTRERTDTVEKIMEKHPDGDDTVVYWLEFDAEKGDGIVENVDDIDDESVELGDEDTDLDEGVLELLEPY